MGEKVMLYIEQWSTVRELAKMGYGIRKIAKGNENLAV